MLKIKDNVDLKELEKFGFIKYELCLTRLGTQYHFTTPRHNSINVYEDDRVLSIYDGYGFDFLDKLFDLIEAGLVEKVKE